MGRLTGSKLPLACVMELRRRGRAVRVQGLLSIPTEKPDLPRDYLTNSLQAICE